MQEHADGNPLRDLHIPHPHRPTYRFPHADRFQVLRHNFSNAFKINIISFSILFVVQDQGINQLKGDKLPSKSNDFVFSIKII